MVTAKKWLNYYPSFGYDQFRKLVFKDQFFMIVLYNINNILSTVFLNNILNNSVRIFYSLSNIKQNIAILLEIVMFSCQNFELL